MWIVPNNHPLYSAHAQGCVASKEALKEVLNTYGTYTVVKDDKEEIISKLPLMWKSNPLSPGIWLRKWKNVYWFRDLCSRTLNPSHGNSFAEKYASSLVDIHVSPSHLLVVKAESLIHDTSSHISNEGSMQFDLFAVSSKTSQTTSISDTEKSEKLYNGLVTRLKREYSLRNRWARLIFAAASSSLQWPTPTAVNRVRDEETLQKCLDYRKENANQNPVPLYLEETVRNWATPTVKGNNNAAGISEKAGDGLTTQAKMWTTPLASDLYNRKDKYKQGGTPLSLQAQQWTTPNARDWKDSAGMSASRRDGKSRFDQLPRQVFGLLHKDEISSNGKNLVLNPKWVLQLMGTTLSKTFFEWEAMESLSSKHKSHSQP